MKTLAIIPAYNEVESIASVIDELRNDVPGTDFVVINDGSRDETAAICRAKGVKLIDLPVNLGLTGAVQTGMRYAYQHGYDAAVQIDADGQHVPKYIPRLAEKMQNEGLDIVIGSRFVTEKRPFTIRMIANTVLDYAIRMTTGKRMSDPTSGMRMYGKRVLGIMANDINASPEPDTVAYLMRCGARVEDMQVTMRERMAGESYLNAWKSIKYMMRMCLNICFVQWFRERRRL